MTGYRRKPADGQCQPKRMLPKGNFVPEFIPKLLLNIRIMKLACLLLTTALLLRACTKPPLEQTSSTKVTKVQVQEWTDQLTAAEMADDLSGFLEHYEENAISMPEYQPALYGKTNIATYYREIFRRQDIQSYQRTTEEIIHLGRTIVEIGTFQKSYYEMASADSLLAQNGKYWHTWVREEDGSYELKGEAFGYLHPIDQAEALVVTIPDTPPPGTSEKIAPFELRAYNALMEKLVQSRDGADRSAFYAPDGKFMPFAEPSVSGEAIKPYLTEYSSRGEITIDSVSIYTDHFERFEAQLLEYYQFRVQWSAAAASGRTTGKGIRIWRRQADGSLKMYREISTHNY